MFDIVVNSMNKSNDRCIEIVFWFFFFISLLFSVSICLIVTQGTKIESGKKKKKKIVAMIGNGVCIPS